MGKVIRQSLLSTAITYLGVTLGAFNTLWLIPKVMSTGEIGLYRVVISMAILLVPFAQMGASQGSIKFFPEYKSQEDRNRFFTGLLLFSFCSYLLFISIFSILEQPISSFFIERSPEVSQYFNLVLFLVLMMVIFGILESYSRNMLEIAIPNFLKEVQIRIINTLLITLFFLGYVGFEQLLFSLVWNYMAAITFLTLSLIYRYKLRLRFDLKSLKIQSFIKYALYSVLGAGGAVIVMQIDSIMITGLLGLDQNGVYTTAFYIAVMIEIPRRAISQLSTPLISKAFHEGLKTEVDHIYKRSSINLLLAGAFIYLLIIVNLDNIFYLIPDWQRFEAGKIVVIIVGAAKLIDIGSGVNTEIIIMSKYYRFNIITILFLSILTILSNLWLIPDYGIAGAAMATTLSLILFNLVKFLFIWFKLKIQPFTLKTGMVLILLLLLVMAYPYLPQVDGVLYEIILHSLLISMVFIIGNYLLKTSYEMNSIIDKFIKKN